MEKGRGGQAEWELFELSSIRTLDFILSVTGMPLQSFEKGTAALYVFEDHSGCCLKQEWKQ